jgi:spore germination protein
VRQSIPLADPGPGAGRDAGPGGDGGSGSAAATREPDGRAQRRPRRYIGAVWLAVVVAAAVAVGLILFPATSGPASSRVVAAALPYWNIGHGTATVLSHRGAFTEVSPWIYGLGSGGQIETQYPAGQAAEVKAEMARLRAAGLRVVPTLANVSEGRFAYQPVAGILHDPARRKQHVAAITALVSRHHYAGIDIDYEDLRAGDRRVFTAFISELAAALHARDKILSVALFPKATDAGYAPRNVAQDYAAIGRVADQVRIMAYGYHWDTSPPGPIAPVNWIREVIRYAKDKIPAAKVVLGVGLYGYDWSRGPATAVSWLRAFQLSTRHHARPHYDATSQAPWFTYTDSDGHKHTVWFENEASTRAKFEIAKGSQIGGVFLWMFGYEDTGTWAALRHSLPLPEQPAPSPARPSTP